MTPRGYRRVRLAWRSPPTTSSGDRPYRHDDVNLPGADVLQQSLQIGTVGRPTRVSPIVIAGPDQGPAGMGLAFDIGGGSIVLRIQRVELLVEPVLGRDTGIDRAADRSDGWSLHDRASIVDRSSLSRKPKKRGPFHLVPVKQTSWSRHDHCDVFSASHQAACLARSAAATE